MNVTSGGALVVPWGGGGQAFAGQVPDKDPSAALEDGEGGGWAGPGPVLRPRSALAVQGSGGTRGAGE